MNHRKRLIIPRGSDIDPAEIVQQEIQQLQATIEAQAEELKRTSAERDELQQLAGVIVNAIEGIREWAWRMQTKKKLIPPQMLLHRLPGPHQGSPAPGPPEAERAPQR